MVQEELAKIIGTSRFLRREAGIHITGRGRNGHGHGHVCHLGSRGFKVFT